ncbi:hypothetical protein A1359_01535 [Methylomonas lenta]|uniref:DUF2231 domain-containing protein n=1 Tax=Methylomonas lenta TaxID=980561 RepID=A0A177N2N8_9GAMM|nr:DUF2231 domain-containing protein [Methylomonas lenta]OAI11733.1 hypothetical protein A1359_01535 [Methylomonas lenta]
MFDLSNNLQFSVHGGADSAGGFAGAVADFLSFIENLLALSPGEMFANVMPGIAGLDNLHPLFVHFPIALLSLFFLLDLLGSIANKIEWRKTASWFLYSGAIFAAMTVAAGLIAADSVAHGGDVHQIMENHEHLGIAVLLLAVTLSGWRLLAKNQISGGANTLYLIFAAILAGLLLFTADLGGLMVYGYGVGVKPVAELNKAAAALHEHGEQTEIHEQNQATESPTSPTEHHHNHMH